MTQPPPFIQPCEICGRPSETGGHGVRDGAVYSEHFCLDCYNARYRANTKGGDE